MATVCVSKEKYIEPKVYDSTGDMIICLKILTAFDLFIIQRIWFFV